MGKQAFLSLPYVRDAPREDKPCRSDPGLERAKPNDRYLFLSLAGQVYLARAWATFGLAGFTSMRRSFGVTIRSMSSIGMAPRSTWRSEERRVGKECRSR